MSIVFFNFSDFTDFLRIAKKEKLRRMPKTALAVKSVRPVILSDTDAVKRAAGIAAAYGCAFRA